MTTDSGPTIANTYGVALIGCIFAAFLYGITCVQTCRYNLVCQSDSKVVRAIVNFLWILDSVHFAFVVSSVYYFLITKRTDIKPGASALWTNGAILMVSNISDCFVRGIFIYRICHLGGYKLILIFPLGALTAVALGLGITCGAMFVSIPPAALATTITWPVYTGLSTSAAADITISFTLCSLFYKLGHEVDTAHPIIHKLMRYTINAGVLPSMIALASLIAYISLSETYIAMAFFFVLPKATLNSMLAMLNARRHLLKVSPARQLARLRISLDSKAEAGAPPN